MTFYNSFGFLGGGRITRIILGGFKRKGLLHSDIHVFDPDNDVLKNLQKSYPFINVNNETLTYAASQELIFLAVHPPVVKDLLKQLSEFLNQNSILVSLVPKIKCSQLSEMLHGFSRIVRMIPNAPSIICKGYNPVYFEKSISNKEKQTIQNFFNSIGCFPEVEENMLEAFAIITGMGPTYFWHQINCLRELAIEFGIDEDKSKVAIKEMLNGAIETLFNSDLSPEEVFDLIPVYPLSEIQDLLLKEYRDKLTILHNKLRS